MKRLTFIPSNRFTDACHLPSHPWVPLSAPQITLKGHPCDRTPGNSSTPFHGLMGFAALLEALPVSEGVNRPHMT